MHSSILEAVFWKTELKKNIALICFIEITSILAHAKAQLNQAVKPYPLILYPASRGYIFAVIADVQKVAPADNRSVFYRACAKFVTRVASNWFVKYAWVSRESNLRKLPANYSPQAFVLFFCFAPSGFKYFSRQISTDRLF